MTRDRLKLIVVAILTDPSIWVILLAAILWFVAPSFARFAHWINP